MYSSSSSCSAGLSAARPGLLGKVLHTLMVRCGEPEPQDLASGCGGDAVHVELGELFEDRDPRGTGLGRACFARHGSGFPGDSWMRSLVIIAECRAGDQRTRIGASHDTRYCPGRSAIYDQSVPLRRDGPIGLT